MPTLVSLTCPSCGGKLQIKNDVDRFTCGYCGNEIIVERSGGAITFAPVVDGLKEVKTGVDKTASELAIRRLKDEVSNLAQQRNEIKQAYIKVISFAYSIPFAIGLVIWFFTLNNQLCLPIFIIALVVGVVLHLLLKQRIDGRIAPIDDEIAQKNQEIEKNQALINSK